MAETITCPECQAQLILPALGDAPTVQCPRCRRVFAPSPPRPTPSAPPPPTPRAKEPIETPDAPFEEFASLARYQPLRGEWKATAALACLVLSVISYGCQTYLNFERGELIEAENEAGNRFVRDIRRGRPGNARRPALDQGLALRRARIEWLSSYATLAHHLTYWPTVIFFLIWVNQASWNLRILQASKLIYSPSTAVCSYFIPFLNLLQPYMVMQEIWRASDPDALRDGQSWKQVPASRQVIVWWLAFLAAAFLSVLAWWVQPFRGGDFDMHANNRVLAIRLAGASNILMILAGAALLAIIRGISTRQRLRHARVYDDVA